MICLVFGKRILGSNRSGKAFDRRSRSADCRLVVESMLLARIRSNLLIGNLRIFHRLHQHKWPRNARYEMELAELGKLSITWTVQSFPMGKHPYHLPLRQSVFLRFRGHFIPCALYEPTDFQNFSVSVDIYRGWLWSLGDDFKKVFISGSNDFSWWEMKSELWPALKNTLSQKNILEMHSTCYPREFTCDWNFWFCLGLFTFYI